MKNEATSFWKFIGNYQIEIPIIQRLSTVLKMKANYLHLTANKGLPRYGCFIGTWHSGLASSKKPL